MAWGPVYGHRWGVQRIINSVLAARTDTERNILIPSVRPS